MRFPEPSWFKSHDTTLAAALALLLVGALLACAGHTEPTNDGLHYLDMALRGVGNTGGLAAPFAYRPAVPLIAGAIAAITGIPVERGFLIVALLSSWGLLFTTYLLARASGTGPVVGLLIVTVVSLSFFAIKFHLAAPTRIDIEGLFLTTAAFLQIIRKRYGWALAISALGLLFKEFLLIPGLLVIGIQLRESNRTRTIEPLISALFAACLLLVCFLIPRIIIPVTSGYGENLRWDLSDAKHLGYLQNLRYLLFTRFDPAKLINLVFSLVSFWLPSILLFTPTRARTLKHRLASRVFPASLFMLFLAGLALIGGTNIMIFVVYSTPILVLVLAAQFEAEIHPLEIASMAGAVMIFNRIPVVITGNRLPEEIMGFYGGWWSQIDETTLMRSGEIALAVLVIAFVRFILRRYRTTA
jgi:hypothetical protein